MQAYRFQALDSWRGICAILVAATHFHINSHVYMNTFLRHAGLFVDFFFVLSGFVITHAYGKRLGNVAGVWEFVIRRFGRLWPLHATMLLLFVTSTLTKALLTRSPPLMEGGTNGWAIVSNLLMVHALGMHDRDTWNAPSWSISVEWVTYLFFAAVAFGFLRRSRSVPVALLLLIALAGAATVLVLSPTYLETTSNFGFFRCVYGFFIGSLIYRAWLASRDWGGTAGRLEVLTLLGVVAFVVAGDGAASMAAPVVFGCAVYVFAFDGGPISRLLRASIPAALGRWSYSIYLTHAFVVHAIFVAGRRLILDMELPGVTSAVPTVVLPSLTMGDIGLVGYLLAVVAVSAFTYRVIERPGQAWFNRIAARRRHSGVASGAVTSAPHSS